MLFRNMRVIPKSSTKKSCNRVCSSKSWMHQWPWRSFRLQFVPFPLPCQDICYSYFSSFFPLLPEVITTSLQSRESKNIHSFHFTSLQIWDLSEKCQNLFIHTHGFCGEADTVGTVPTASDSPSTVTLPHPRNSMYLSFFGCC